MHEGGVTLFLVGVAVMGLTPVLLAVVYLARRASDARRREDQAAEDTGTLGALRILAIALVGVVALGGAIAWYLSGSGPAAQPMQSQMPGMEMGGASASMLPSALAGMPVSASVTGAEAVQQVAQLHGADFPVVSAEIGEYGGGRATVWESLAPDAATAADQVARMANGIAAGGSPFDPPKLAAGGDGVWVTHGMGQVHYFFARGDTVWWLSADPDVAKRALSETLEAAA